MGEIKTVKRFKKIIDNVTKVVGCKGSFREISIGGSEDGSAAKVVEYKGWFCDGNGGILHGGSGAILGRF